MIKLIDVNGLLYLWQKIKTALSAKADKTELHSHANKTELDKIREGEVGAWRNMAATDLTVYAKTADVYNKTQVYTKTEVYSKEETYSKTELNGKISSAMRYKGTVINYAALPTTERELGDTYNITVASANNKAGDNAVWAGDHWDILSGVIDTSSFLTEEDIATTSELSAILT